MHPKNGRGHRQHTTIKATRYAGEHLPTYMELVRYIAFYTLYINSLPVSNQCIGRERLNNIRQHYFDNHLTPREHKAAGKKPLNTLPFEDIRVIAVFLADMSDTLLLGN